MTDDLSAVKIIDFGLSTYTDPTRFSNMPTFFQNYVSGTKRYFAPELMTDQGVQGDITKADTFALGVTLINLLTGTYAFNGYFDPLFDQFIDNPISFLQDKIDQPLAQASSP